METGKVRRAAWWCVVVMVAWLGLGVDGEANVECWVESSNEGLKNNVELLADQGYVKLEEALQSTGTGKPLWYVTTGVLEAPGVLLVSGMRGNDLLSVRANMRVFNELRDEAYNLVLRKVHVTFVVLGNPDAFDVNMEKSQQSTMGWRRSNLRQTCGRTNELANSEFIADGVHLNRNFGFEGVDDDVIMGGISPTMLAAMNDPCSGMFGGESSFSENETMAIRDLVNKHTNFAAAIEFQTRVFPSSKGLLIRPFANGQALNSDMDQKIQNLESVINADGNFTNGTVADLFAVNVSGTLLDWLTSKEIPSLTLQGSANTLNTDILTDCKAGDALTDDLVHAALAVVTHVASTSTYAPPTPAPQTPVQTPPASVDTAPPTDDGQPPLDPDTADDSGSSHGWVIMGAVAFAVAGGVVFVVKRRSVPWGAERLRDQSPHESVPRSDHRPLMGRDSFDHMLADNPSDFDSAIEMSNLSSPSGI